MGDIYKERQFLNSRSYTKIATDSGYTTGFCPQRNGWIIRDRWDSFLGWYYPGNHRLWTDGKAIEVDSFQEAIDFLNKKSHPG